MQAAPICVCLLSCQHFTVPARVRWQALRPRSRASPRAAAQPFHGQPSRADDIGRRQRVGVDHRGHLDSPPVVSAVSAGKPRLSSASAIGPSSTWSTTVPSRPTARPPASSGSPVDRAVRGAVEMQQHQHPGRFAQVVDARDGLLPAIAALVQVHAPVRRSSRPRAGSCARRCRRRGGAAARPPGAPRRPTRRRAAPRSGSAGPASRRPGARHHQVEFDRRAAGIRRRKPPSGSGTAVPSAGSAVDAERREHGGSASRGPSSDSTARSAGSTTTSAQNTILRR